MDVSSVSAVTTSTAESPACCRFLPRWRTNRGFEECTRDGASQLTEAGPLPVMGGRVELLKNMRRHHTQRLPHGRRRSFHMAALLRPYQDITFLAGHQECRKNSLLGTSRTLPIMEHFSKCGLHSVSYSVIL